MNFRLIFELPAHLGHGCVLVFEQMDLPSQPARNAIHVIPADKVTLTQWFLRPPIMPQHKNPTAAAQTFPVFLPPPSKEKKKSKHKACSSTNEANSFKNVRKDGLELPCLPSVPKEHDSFKSPFSSSIIRFYSQHNNNAWPGPEKVQLLLC